MTLFAFAAGLSVASPVAHADENVVPNNPSTVVNRHAGANDSSNASPSATVAGPQTPQKPVTVPATSNQAVVVNNDTPVNESRLETPTPASFISLDTAQNKQSQSTDPYQNTLQLPKGWISALKDAKGQQEITDPQLSNELSEFGREGVALNSGKYIPNPNDNYEVRYNADGSIDKRQILILTQYVCRLLNPVREALGNPVYKINQGSIDIADEVAKGYVRDNWYLRKTFAHNYPRLQSVGGDYGVAVSESVSAGYTNSDTAMNQRSHTGNTMNQLKEAAYNSIVGMLFDDGGKNAWGHTTDLTGNRSSLLNSCYLGVAPDALGNFHYNGEPETDGIYAYRLNNAATNSYKFIVDSTTKFNQEYPYTYDVYDDSLDPNTPIALENKASLDNYRLLPGSDSQHAILKVTGWHAADLSRYQPAPFLIVFDNTLGHEVARQKVTHPVARPDVQKVYPYIYNSQNAGFDQEISIPVSSLGHSLSIVARYSDDVTNGEGSKTDYWFSPISFNNGNYASLDSMAIQKGKLHVSGWHASNQAAGLPYHVVILYDASQGREISRHTINQQQNQRTDVANAYATVADALNSGFSADFALTPAMANDNLQLISRWSNHADANSDYVDYWFGARKLVNDLDNYAWLDTISSSNDQVTVAGWNASNQDMGRPYHYIIAFDKTQNREIGRVLVDAANQSRSDVARAYPQVFNAGQSGFKASFRLNSAMANDDIAYISRWTSDPAGNGNAVDYWFSPVNKVDNGYLDDHSYANGRLHVAGWHANDASIYEPYRTLILFDNTANREVSRQTITAVARQDVAKAYPDTRSANQAGFSADFTNFKPIVGHQYSLISRYSLTIDANENYSDKWFALGTLA